MSSFTNARVTHEAVIILYPLLLAKTVVQASRRSNSSNKLSQIPSIRSSIQEIYAAGGFFALYRGLGAQLLKGVLRQGTSMMVKQRSLVFRLSPIHVLNTCLN